MKTVKEIFYTVGVLIESSTGWPSYKGFRAFEESDIKAIQDEAFKQGWAEGHNAGYLEGREDARKDKNP